MWHRRAISGFTNIVRTQSRHYASVGKNSDGNRNWKNNIWKWTFGSIIGAGALSGYIGYKFIETSQQTKQRFVALMSPTNDPLWKQKLPDSERNAPIDSPKMREHIFQFMSSQEALGFDKNDKKCELAVLRFTPTQWKNAIEQMLGSDYGRIQIHHIVLSSMHNISHDMYFQPVNSKCGLLTVSSDHDNWIWMSQRQTIVSIYWSDQKQTYVGYIRDANVVLEWERDESTGNLSHPVRVVYFSNARTPQGHVADSSEVKALLHKFADDQEAFRKNALFIE